MILGLLFDLKALKGFVAHHLFALPSAGPIAFRSPIRWTESHTLYGRPSSLGGRRIRLFRRCWGRRDDGRSQIHIFASSKLIRLVRSHGASSWRFGICHEGVKIGGSLQSGMVLDRSM